MKDEPRQLPAAREQDATAFDIRTVLIGTSVTTASDEVVRNGLRVARACGAKVHLAHAFQAPIAYAAGAPYGVPVYIPDVIEARRESRLRLLAAQVARLGVRPEEEASRTVLEGAPHFLLAETAAAAGADLVVVAAAEGWERVKKLLGSTADRVVRQAPCPVLVTRGELRVPPRRLLFAVDLSAISGEAMRRGLEVAGALGGAAGGGGSMIAAALLVVEIEPVVLDTAPEPALFARLDPAARVELERFIAAYLPDPRWRVAPMLRTGHSPAAEILRLADDLEPDLLVLGTHGRRGLRRLLVGSVAERVLRHSTCSVLVVPGAQTEATAA
ncbi:MAG TPA: universal stress protein [Thermoanaerobaculia bacterium]|nr:universal stress protein [Thermoanaerobaculia bacterium]